MTSPLLESLRPWLAEELDDLTVTSDGMRARSDVRFGEVEVRVDHDEEAEAARVQVSIVPPAGGGVELVVYCLALNTQYWDVKIGLDEDGTLAIHSDLEVEGREPEALAADVLDRLESIVQLLDEDLTEHLLERGLGTPSQRARWARRRPAPSVDPEP